MKLVQAWYIDKFQLMFLDFGSKFSLRLLDLLILFQSKSLFSLIKSSAAIVTMQVFMYSAAAYVMQLVSGMKMNLPITRAMISKWERCET